ncbi:MAG: hypothetical protein MUC87_12430 [Bacteroidia bacterium]|jgi:hypothetical protein|nr:hypothetical protein [Bacteroidia bacterium]
MSTVAQKSLYELHAEHREWLNKLAFYSDEIKYMTTRLQEVTVKNTGHDVLAQAEHFQNQFIIQRNHIDNLNHEIKEQEKLIESNINHNPVATDRRKADDHVEERDAMMQFEKIFNELRREYLAWLGKVM